MTFAIFVHSIGLVDIDGQDKILDAYGQCIHYKKFATDLGKTALKIYSV